MKNPIVHAVHIIECIEKLEDIYAQDPTFKNPYHYDAVLRNLQTMAESTKHIDTSIHRSNPHIKWQEIWGFRNVLVHDYLGDIDPMIVKNVITSELCVLKQALENAYPEWRKLKDNM